METRSSRWNRVRERPNFIYKLKIPPANNGGELQLASRDFGEYGQSDTNARGESLLEHRGTDSLILNRGNEPIFQDRLRTEVIDATLLKIASKGFKKNIKNKIVICYFNCT